MDVGAISQGGQNFYNINNSSANSNEGIQTSAKQNDAATNTNTNTNSGDKPVNEKDLKKAVQVVNDLLKDKSTHVEYEQDKDFKNTTIVKVVDNVTKQVINEIPPKKILDMIAQFCEMAGLIVNKKA